LVFLGSRDEVAHLGYVQGQCPKCGNQGVFTVYLNKRKLTVSVVAAFSVGQQYVLECRNCGVKFGIPPAMQAELQQRLISADRLADFVGRMPSLEAETAGAEMAPTLYAVLQVDPYADPDVIEAAFKRLALKHHPDRSRDPDSPAMMRELLAARDVLEDPVKRRSYDASIGIVAKIKPPKPVKPVDGLRPDDV
jgi:hypothetical protein